MYKVRNEHFVGVELDRDFIAAHMLPFIAYILGEGFVDGMGARNGCR